MFHIMPYSGCRSKPIYAILAKNFVISNGSPGRLAKFLPNENIYISQSRRAKGGQAKSQSIFNFIERR